MVQGELFREESSSDRINHFGIDAKNSFLSHYRLTVSLDKLFLVLITIVVIFVLTYSFGVERGKRVMEKRLETLFPTHSETVATAPYSGDVEESMTFEKTVLLVNDEESKAKEEAVEPIVEPVIQPLLQSTGTKRVSPSRDLTREGKYTVQLVTYVDQRLAEQEVTRLKSKGHGGFIIPSGRYFQVCVNYFENLSKARSLLKQLRENGRYPDAYVRPVVR